MDQEPHGYHRISMGRRSLGTLARHYRRIRARQSRCNCEACDGQYHRGKKDYCGHSLSLPSADPVGAGLVASLARPGGNITGLSIESTDLAGKRLELLHEVVPHRHRLAILVNAASPASLLERREVAARKLGFVTVASEIRLADDIAPAFEVLKGSADALYVCADPLLNTNRTHISALASDERLPMMLDNREFVAAEV